MGSPHGGYSLDGDRYVYPSKPARHVDLAERRPLEECDDCGCKTWTRARRRVSRSNIIVRTLVSLFDLNIDTQPRIMSWYFCKNCDSRTPVSIEYVDT